MTDEETGHQWERMAGKDFREDIPPSFEWWRKYVYEPANEGFANEIKDMKKQVGNTMKLLWGILIVNLGGVLGIVGILLSKPAR